MDHKRNWADKYVHCYCNKDTEVLVGIKLYAWINPIGSGVGAAFVVWAFIADVDIVVKLGAFSLMGLPWLVGYMASYYNAKRKMLKHGHSPECSRKVARSVMVYSSLWTEFKFIEKEDDDTTSTLTTSRKGK